MGNNSQEQDTVELQGDSPELIPEKEDTRGFVLVAFTTAQFKKLSDSDPMQFDKHYFVHDRDISNADKIFADIKKSSINPTKKKNTFSKRISGISSVCSSSSGHYGDISSGISSSSASSKRDR